MPDPALAMVAQRICDVDHYTFDGFVGEGAFKETFRVVAADETPIALKLLRPGYSSHRTQREIDAMERCNHPAIGKLLSLAEFQLAGTKYTYCLEEFLAGGTLTESIERNGLLAAVQTKRLGRSLISALDHLFQRDLVHRDILPGA
jgi:serine/threonine protein kinase